jgi:hypothetical protein
MRRNAQLLVTAVLLAAAIPVSADPYAPRVGRRQPDFTLPDIATGKPVSLSDFSGKKLLLIHFSSW